MKQPGKKMKLWKKIVLGFLAAVLVIVAGLLIWQWDNVKAFYYLKTMTPEQIEQKVDEAYQKRQEIVDNYGGITVKDLNPEQEKELMHGEMSAEEAKEIIENTSDPTVGENEQDTNAQQNAGQNASPEQNTQKPQPEQQAPVSKESEIANRYLKQIYNLKAEFIGQIATIMGEAKAEFYKFPMEERTKANKTAVVTARLVDCYELENQCDIKVNALLKEMEKELKAIGADTKIVNEIKNAYKEEKSIKKAYYINLANVNF